MEHCTTGNVMVSTFTADYYYYPRVYGYGFVRYFPWQIILLSVTTRYTYHISNIVLFCRIHHDSVYATLVLGGVSFCFNFESFGQLIIYLLER